LIGLENAEDNGNNLFDFLGSVYSWEYTTYLAECFDEEPKQVKDIDGDEAQVSVLAQAAASKLKSQEYITILDYGCGEIGRIGQNLVKRYTTPPNKVEWLKTHIQYYVYDKYNIDGAEINMDKIPCLVDILKELNDIKNKKETFDFILLFNVLHEIEAENWAEVLNILLDALKNDGAIIFCERESLVAGEKHNEKNGYLVLSVEELKLLFQTAGIEELPVPDKSPITAALIKKSVSIKVTNDSIIEALKELEKRTNKEINSVLDGIVKKSSRKYAFCCQQYFNARFAVGLLNNIRNYPTDLEEYSLAELLEIEDPVRREMLIMEWKRRRKKNYE
jgi:SAM-dependent methyltransferase